MLTLEDLMEPHEVVAKYPGLFTEKQFDWMLRNRRRSGLDAAVVKVHRKLFIDRAALEVWLESHREGDLAATA